MNINKNARLTPKGREVLVHRLMRGERAADVACAIGGQPAHGLQMSKAVSRARDGRVAGPLVKAHFKPGPDPG